MLKAQKSKAKQKRQKKPKAAAGDAAAKSSPPDTLNFLSADQARS
jgi:hypothetical protein